MKKNGLLAAGLAWFCISAQAANITVDITGSMQVLPDGACNSQCASNLGNLAADSGLSTSGYNPLKLSLDIDLDATPYDGSLEFSGFYGYAIRRVEVSFGNLTFVSLPQAAPPSANFGQGNTLRLQAPPYVSRMGVSLSTRTAGVNGEAMASAPVTSLSGPTVGYQWRSASVNFWSAAFTSQDLNDLPAMLGAANLFGGNSINYFDVGVDVVNPSVTLGTDGTGQLLYSTLYPTFSLRGTVTDMGVRPAVVPLPAAVWLLGSAFAALAGRIRRRV